jgi:hypothetical protein
MVITLDKAAEEPVEAKTTYLWLLGTNSGLWLLGERRWLVVGVGIADKIKTNYFGNFLGVIKLIL